MKKISVLLFLFLFALETSAQQADLTEINQLLQKKHYEMMNERDPFDNKISGSPYLSEEYITSRVFFKEQKKPVKAELRYNAYSEEFEFSQGGYRFVISNMEQIDSIEYLNQHFIYTTYIDETGRSQDGFLARLINGPCVIYKMYSIEFYQAEPPKSGYDEFKPARFESEDPKYCIRLKRNTSPKIIKSFRRKKFLEYFESSKKELKQYIKDENLRLRKEEDLIQFITHYNTHYGKG